MTHTQPSTLAVAVALPLALTCTGVDGIHGGNIQYIPMTVSVPTSGQAGIIWQAADFAGAPAQFPSNVFSISCNLPPGVGLGQARLNFTENDN